MMRDPNWTLRFPRTGKEVYGYDIDFDDDRGDRTVLVVCLIALAFVAGLFIGGVL